MMNLFLVREFMMLPIVAYSYNKKIIQLQIKVQLL